jgi:hypothetical protein
MEGGMGRLMDSEFSKARLANLMQAKFGHLLKDSVSGFAQKIPIKYHKIISIASGAVITISPFVFRFFKKKQWIFYVIIGVAEIVTTLFTEKEKEQRTVVYASL